MFKEIFRKSLLWEFFIHLKFMLNLYVWRKINKHNRTFPIGNTRVKHVLIGNGTYGFINIISRINDVKAQIGNYVSIAEEVLFLLGIDHNTTKLSTYPYETFFKSEEASISKGDIIVEDDVWIGRRAIILSGLTIHQGAVIAAGAVVTKDIPPYAIAVGVPARVIKYRFEAPVINFLLTLDYSQLTEDMIRTHIDDLYTPLDTLSLDQIRSLYSWFPKKRADMAASATASAASSTATTPGADASADSAPSELTTTQQHYQCDQYDRNSHMSENTTENNAEENSEVELLMMDQKSINSIIAVIQDSDLPLIKTCFNTVTVTTKSDGTEGHELRILIADYVSFNPCTPLANAWVADNILLFTVFDGVLENRYGLQEGASFRNHYDNIPEVTDLDKMSKFCYRVMKLIRNAIQHNLSAVHYTPPSGQNTASFGPYSINYIHRGTTFSLDIDNKAVQFLYTIVVNLVTNSINKMQLTQGHYEGILNAMFEQMKEGISSLSDDISVWSNTNTASTTTPTTVATSPASSTNVNNATSSPSQQSQQNQQSSQQTSTARYDSQHLRFYQRYVVENPVIIQDDVESAIAGSSGNSSFVIFKHIEENPTIDETSNQYWYSTDYRYKDYLLPQELGSITWGTGSDVISCREQAIIRFNKADITDRWKLR